MCVKPANKQIRSNNCLNNAIAITHVASKKYSCKSFSALTIKDNLCSMEAENNKEQTFYHGTKANFKNGDLISPGFTSNYGQRKTAKYIYFAATMEAAIWGAELAVGDGPQKIYMIDPTGHFEDDPNLTDKKFPGNPTKSYRSLHPLRVTGEVKEWQGHSPEQLNAMKENLEKLKQQGIEAIED